MEFVVHVNSIIEHEGKILFVQEAKAKAYGKWNLPGGHLEFGERIAAGAQREVMEETGAAVIVDALVGTYVTIKTNHNFCYIFAGHLVDAGTEVIAGDNILASAWFTVAEMLAKGDEEIVNPTKIRQALKDYTRGKRAGLDSVTENYYD